MCVVCSEFGVVYLSSPPLIKDLLLPSLTIKLVIELSISQHFFSQHTFVSQYTMIVVLFVLALFVAHILVKLSRFALEQYQLYQALKCIPGPEIRMPLFGNINLLLDIASKAEIKNDVSKGKFVCSF